MPEEAWKVFERSIAESLGTERTPLSGGASRHTRADVLHDELYVECKYRQRLAVETWFNEALRNAVTENKRLVLAVHEKGRRGALAVIDWTWFLELYDAWRKDVE
ncbi:MAG: hypothetical protein JRD89_15015 [Deltaproteobacteria bacterium]|nr:hypothetical protein [Deltaproteobacteria bacterium]